MLKTIKIKEETHKELMRIGMKGETFDELFNRLIKFYKKQDRRER